MSNVTHKQAAENIAAATADGVEAGWENQVAAIIKYLTETQGEISWKHTSDGLAALVERHTGTKIDLELAHAALDIATA